MRLHKNVFMNAVCWVLLAVSGCDRTNADQAKVAGKAAGEGNAASAVKAEPGVASGRVTTADGKPIKIDGVQIDVHISGVTLKGGERVTYAVKPDANGNFKIKVAEGRYLANAGLQVPFGNETFGFSLVQTGVKPQGDEQDSAEAPIFNFEWRLNGLKPGMPKKKDNPRNWLGASVDVKYRRLSDARNMPVFPPKGTTFTFKLSPKGKLADGSEGKLMEFTCAYDTVMDDVDQTSLVDIPLGEYELSGKQIEPGGKEKTLEFSPSTDQKTFSKTAAVTFAPAGIAAEPTGKLYIIRPVAQ